MSVLDGFRADILPFDRPDLLAKIAALQLMPENAERAIRLEAIAHAVVSESGQSDLPRISLNSLRGLCNHPTITDGFIRSAEDPCDNLFTEAITFEGGSYVVFPGICDESTFIVRSLIKALFQVKSGAPEELKRLVRPLVGAVLAVSSEIAAKAGLHRGVDPVASPGGKAIVPASGRLQQLVEAVTFQKSELGRVLNRVGASPEALNSLTGDIGTGWSAYDMENGPLHATPLVRIRDGIVVTEPGVLLSSLRHHIIRLAIDNGFGQELARLYHLATWDSAVDALRCLRLYFVGTPERSCDVDGQFTEGVFALDTDKALYVQLVTDDLSHYRADQVFGEWRDDELVGLLSKRAAQIQEELFCSTPAPNEVVVLVLIQGAGRFSLFGLGRDEDETAGPLLCMRVSDLETIGLAELGDPLVLLKYAQARERMIRNGTKIVSTGQLDEFQFYRSRGYSYYASDKARPNFVGIVPGFAGQIRREVAHSCDRHGAHSYNPGCAIEVAGMYSDKIPIYTTLIGADDRVCVLVEEPLLPIWIVGPEYSDPVQYRLHEFYVLMARMISYWMWRCGPSLGPMLESLAHKSGPMVIELSLSLDADWHHLPGQTADLPDGNETESVRVTLQPERFRALLTFEPSVLGLLARADNVGERHVMDVLLRSLYSMAERATGKGHSDPAGEVREIIDRHMPVGVQKMVVMLDQGQMPQLDPSGLPAFRKVNHADRDGVLDHLGEHLASEGWTAEAVASADKSDFINRNVVAFFYARLTELVATLRPVEALEWLVAQHESVTRELFHLRLTIPTRLACFGDDQDMVRNIGQEFTAINEAALCVRFLIEYVAACPPVGVRPMSYEVYDRLLALASQLISWALDSDYLKYGITDIELSLLPSGRLGADREQLLKAQNAFMQEHTVEEMDAAGRAFGRYWEASPEGTKAQGGSNEDSFAGRFENAFKAEFGFTFADLSLVFREIYRIGTEMKGVVKTADMADVKKHLLTVTGWTETEVTAVMTLLTLEPRSSYLVPPAPFCTADVYPWRFNRPLSYIRRPLLLTKAQRVIWGNRHLAHSFNNASLIVLNGRLVAGTDDMRALLGEINRGRGLAFNNRVADIFESVPSLLVRRRVKKLNGRRIGAPGDDLGDVDVLVVDKAARLALAVECKDLALARTPDELRNELDELFKGKGGKSSTVNKHVARTEWVRANIDGLFGEFDIVAKGKWRVEPILVVDEMVFSSHFYPSPIAVVPERLLPDVIRRRSGGWYAILKKQE